MTSPVSRTEEPFQFLLTLNLKLVSHTAWKVNFKNIFQYSYTLQMSHTGTSQSTDINHEVK